MYEFAGGADNTGNSRLLAQEHVSLTLELVTTVDSSYGDCDTVE